MIERLADRCFGATRGYVGEEKSPTLAKSFEVRGKTTENQRCNVWTSPRDESDDTKRFKTHIVALDYLHFTVSEMIMIKSNFSSVSDHDIGTGTSRTVDVILE